MAASGASRPPRIRTPTPTPAPISSRLQSRSQPHPVSLASTPTARPTLVATTTVAAGGAATRQSAARLPRPLLEEAFTRLTEENARLRRELSAQNSLWQIAHQDPLTQLWNRRYADQRLGEEMSRAQRESGHKFSVVLIDVDHMKQINDQFGHAAGDEALRWVARFLKQGLRGHDLCCRVGGDEFLLILPGSNEKDCRELVRRIGRRWASAADEAGAAGGGAVAVSIGTASFPEDGRTIEALFSVADDAMYTNKRRQDPSRTARPPAMEGRVPSPAEAAPPPAPVGSPRPPRSASAGRPGRAS